MTELQNTPTPHIGAKQGEIAETILLPGDPLRAKYIAEHFLTDAKQFNTTRNMYGYTGYYQGKRVSVMGTGRYHASFPFSFRSFTISSELMPSVSVSRAA